jgi:acid phosphatase (class A)
MIVIAGAVMATCAMAQAPTPATSGTAPARSSAPARTTPPARNAAPAGTAASTSASARTSTATATQGGAPSRAAGYLPANAVDMFAVMPPAPMAGDARYEHDRRVFKETRALEGSARWRMAAADAELGNAAMLKHFSCSIGMELTPEQAPRTVALAQKATRDAAQAMAKAKDHYKRQRPFLIDEGKTCVAHSTVGESYDYPSGHTTAGWSWALVLSQVSPQDANALLARGRAIGDSRVVCGMHNASAVDAARLSTSATMALVTATPEYQTDLAAARAELVGLRAGQYTRPDPARCAEEAALVKIP